MKKSFVIAIAVVLCLAVVGAAFALYKVEPVDKTISISAGDAVRLTIGGLTGATINPDTDMVKTITLSDSTKVQNYSGEPLTSGTGKLTIAVAGDLAEALTVSFDVGGEVKNKSDLASGVDYALTAHPITGTLTIAFDDANENLDFSDYAEKTATVTISYEYNEFAPVDGVWYLVGTNNGWAINAGAIALTDDPGDGNRAKKAGVSLAPGQYKAVQYNTNTWAGKDYDANWTIESSGTYDIYVNNNEDLKTALWIEEAQ